MARPSPPPKRPRLPALLSRRRGLLIGLALALATLAVYWPVHDHAFINYDDGLYITERPRVQEGLTLENVLWALTAREASNWHPLTWLSHLTDVSLFGLEAGRHHLVNLGFHILNTLLLFGILGRLTQAPWKSAFVAALFALHPLHVESVAWVAERKDLLSTLFGLLTLGAYARYAAQPGWRPYLLSLLCFALGLMAKPMLVTLPFLLLLLDHWPLNRLLLPWGTGFGTAGPTAPVGERPRQTPAKAAVPPPAGGTLRPLLLEKIPFFLLAALSSLLTLWAQQKTIQTLEHFPLGGRIANALVSYTKYLGLTLWPQGLAPFYPHPGTHPLWLAMTAAAILAGLTFLAVRAWRRHPWFAVGWFWYLGTLVPVIGLVQVGLQAMADRYTYLPLIGIFLLLAWGAEALLAGLPRRRAVLAGLAATALLACLVLTGLQVRHWRDSVTLFTHTLQVTEGNDVAHHNLGSALLEQGEAEQAITHFQAVLRLQPGRADAWNDLGRAYGKLGRIDEAIRALQKALESTPDDPVPWNNLGMIYGQSGETDKAIAALQEALRLRPDYPEALNNLGNAYGEAGRIDDAIATYERLLRTHPRHVKAWNNLGVAYGDLGQFARAVEPFRASLRLQPRQPHVWRNLGTVLRRAGRPAEAAEAFREALRLQPEDPRALQGLAAAYRELGQPDRAREAEARLQALPPPAPAPLPGAK